MVGGVGLYVPVRVLCGVGGGKRGWVVGGERDQQFFSTSIISAIRGSEAVFKYSNS